MENQILNSSGIAQSDCRNLLVRAMTPEDFALISPHLQRIRLELDDELTTPGQPFKTLCFPEGGIVSFSDLFKDGTHVGIGHLGYEGLAGWPLLLGSDRAPHEARVTIGGGTALRIGSDRLIEACRASETLNDLLLRFVQAFIVQLSRTIVSNLTQEVEARLARWTLMAHDRLDGDEIEVTHKQIGVMLGVRRASVTDTLHLLEGEGLIRCRRGVVIVRDRAGLHALAGETYGLAEAEYSRLIAPFGKG